MLRGGSDGDNKSVVRMQQSLLSPLSSSRGGDYAKSASQSGRERPGSTFPGSRSMSEAD